MFKSSTPQSSFAGSLSLGQKRSSGRSRCSRMQYVIFLYLCGNFMYSNFDFQLREYDDNVVNSPVRQAHDNWADALLGFDNAPSGAGNSIDTEVDMYLSDPQVGLGSVNYWQVCIGCLHFVSILTNTLSRKTNSATPEYLLLHSTSYPSRDQPCPVNEFSPPAPRLIPFGEIASRRTLWKHYRCSSSPSSPAVGWILPLEPARRRK